MGASPPYATTAEWTATVPTPAPTTFRRWVELKTGPVLVLLHRAPRFAVALIPPVLIVGGLVAPTPYGLIPILLGTGFLGWLAYLSWPQVEPRSRIFRASVLGFIVAYGSYRSTR